MIEPKSEEENFNSEIENETAQNSTAFPTIAEALKQVAELDKKLAEANDKMLRALAEAENTRRRAERERQDTAKFSNTNFAKDLLTVADNLRRALETIEGQDAIQSNELIKVIYEGVASTERELLRAFTKHGITKIEPLDKHFDPNFHEVIFEAQIAGKKAGTIIQVMETGYMIHERLLRPARVGVAKGNENGVSSEGSIFDTEV